MDTHTSRIAIYKSPDQEAVRRDLEILFDRNSDFYIKEYEELRQYWGCGGMPRPSWNWAAFFGGPAWFLYRKLYGMGALFLLLPAAFDLLLGDFPLDYFTVIVVGAGANFLYVDWALRQIVKADALGLEGEDRAEHLRRVGGVSEYAGIAGFLFLLALIAAAVFRR